MLNSRTPILTGAAMIPALMTARPYRVVMLGAPGSGKSTHAARLAERLGAAHLNLGIDVPGGGGRGLADGPRRSASWSPTASWCRTRSPTRSSASGFEALPADREFVLEGYPRNAAQADALHRVLADLGRLEPRPVVVQLDTSRDELLRRLRRRRDIEDRSDDTDEAIARRLEIYDETTTPVAGMVAEWADVVPINGDQSVDAVADGDRGRAGPPG